MKKILPILAQGNCGNRIGVIVSLGIFFVGCADPTLDATDQDSLEASVEILADTLDVSKRAEFRKAVGLVMLFGESPDNGAAELAEDGDMPSAIRRAAKLRLHGKDAEQIMSEASQISERLEKEREVEALVSRAKHLRREMDFSQALEALEAARTIGGEDGVLDPIALEIEEEMEGMKRLASEFSPLASEPSQFSAAVSLLDDLKPAISAQAHATAMGQIFEAQLGELASIKKLFDNDPIRLTPDHVLRYEVALKQAISIRPNDFNLNVYGQQLVRDMVKTLRKKFLELANDLGSFAEAEDYLESMNAAFSDHWDWWGETSKSLADTLSFNVGAVELKVAIDSGNNAKARRIVEALRENPNLGEDRYRILMRGLRDN